MELYSNSKWVSYLITNPKPENSDKMVNALKRVGADVQYTLYPDAAHDSWTETYNNPKLYQWFLKHKRKKD